MIMAIFILSAVISAVVAAFMALVMIIHGAHVKRRHRRRKRRINGNKPNIKTNKNSKTK